MEVGKTATWRAWSLGLLGGLVLGCSSRATIDELYVGGAASGPLTVEGSLALVIPARAGTGEAPVKAAGTEVRASVDRNRNQEIDPGESVTALSDADGKFKLQLAVARGDTVVVRFHQRSAALQLRSLRAEPDTRVALQVALHGMDELTCNPTRCVGDGNRLSLTGMGADIKGRARVFNPVTEADAFPGSYRDSDGNLLLSGVFAEIEAERDGRPLIELDAAAVLRLTLPRDAWRSAADSHPGTGRIEVPFYSFNETLGSWVRQSEGYLEDGAGQMLGEDALASIRDGSFSGALVARGEVRHLSYWNVTWPVDSHGCLGGRVLDAEGVPAKGATVTAEGLTYPGTSAPFTTGDDGRFCLEVLRSESSGEDLDRNGAANGTHRVSARISYQDQLFQGGEFDTPPRAGSCGGSSCAPIGDISLTEDRRLTPRLCRVEGRVRDSLGAPLAAVMVYAWDSAIDVKQRNGLCGVDGKSCANFVYSDGEGRFELTAPAASALRISGWSSQQVKPGDTLVRWGDRFVSACPEGELPLTLDQGKELLTLKPIVAHNQIWWDPPLPANALYVIDGVTQMGKWILSGEIGFEPAVTYGKVPAGAQVGYPFSGISPEPLKTGDEVNVQMNGVREDGLPRTGSGTAVAP